MLVICNMLGRKYIPVCNYRYCPCCWVSFSFQSFVLLWRCSVIHRHTQLYFMMEMHISEKVFTHNLFQNPADGRWFPWALSGFFLPLCKSLSHMWTTLEYNIRQQKPKEIKNILRNRSVLHSVTAKKNGCPSSVEMPSLKWTVQRVITFRHFSRTC